MASGNPDKYNRILSLLYIRLFLNSASFDSFNKMSCVKRSLQVYPVTHNSGNTITFAPFATVSINHLTDILCIIGNIRHTDIRSYCCHFYKPVSHDFSPYRLQRFKISFNSSTLYLYAVLQK